MNTLEFFGSGEFRGAGDPGATDGPVDVEAFDSDMSSAVKLFVVRLLLPLFWRESLSLPELARQ